LIAGRNPAIMKHLSGSAEQLNEQQVRVCLNNMVAGTLIPY